MSQDIILLLILGALIFIIYELALLGKSLKIRSVKNQLEPFNLICPIVSRKEYIKIDNLLSEIDKEIEFYASSSVTQEFEHWSNKGAIGALNSLKDNISKLSDK